VLHHTVAGHLHALRGEVDAARAELTRADDFMREGLPNEFGTPLRAAWAVQCLIAGEPEEAARHVAEALAALGETKEPLYTPVLYALGVRAEAERAALARTLRRHADLNAVVDRARALAADLNRLLGVWRGGKTTPGAAANAALARAELSRVEGANDPRRWEAVVHAWEALTEPHAAAYARLRLAEAVLLAGGERAAAGRELAAAHSAAARLGAAPLRIDVETLARRARVALVAPAPPPAERDGPADQLGLTSREAEVLRLLADGLTNREIAARLFISQKTVASHVAHIFDKLAVHSRVEAAGRAHQLGLVQRRS
jgi:DNA-binding NarL/FixJ family response regulator